MSKKKNTKFRRVSPHGFCFRHDCPFVFCGLLNQSAVKKAVEYCVEQTPDVEPELLREFLLSKELYAAQGFPSDYKFEFDWNGKPYSKKAQVARCGNSVCPQMAEMLVRANVTEMAYKKPIRTMRELEKAIAV